MNVLLMFSIHYLSYQERLHETIDTVSLSQNIKEEEKEEEEEKKEMVIMAQIVLYLKRLDLRDKMVIWTLHRF